MKMRMKREKGAGKRGRDVALNEKQKTKLWTKKISISLVLVRGPQNPSTNG
jgi:hypothetical protein